MFALKLRVDLRSCDTSLYETNTDHRRLWLIWIDNILNSNVNHFHNIIFGDNDKVRHISWFLWLHILFLWFAFLVLWSLLDQALPANHTWWSLLLFYVYFNDRISRKSQGNSWQCSRWLGGGSSVFMWSIWVMALVKHFFRLWNIMYSHKVNKYQFILNSCEVGFCLTVHPGQETEHGSYLRSLPNITFFLSPEVTISLILY